MTARTYSKQALITALSLSISLTGETGVGSSSTEEALLPHYPTATLVTGGSLMQEFREAEGFADDKEGFAAFVRAHPEREFDKLVDERLMAEALKNCRINSSRLIHAYSPYSFHVLLICPYDVRAKRRQKQGKYKQYSVKQVEEMTRQRDIDDWARYEVLYPGCRWAESDYDLVFDTSVQDDPALRGRLIKQSHEKWLDRNRSKISYALDLALVG